MIMLMSYSEAPTLTLEDVAFAEHAVQPSQQDEAPVKSEDYAGDDIDKSDGNDGYTTYEEFARKYQQYLQIQEDSF